MRKLTLGPSVTVFLLFFVLALMEALQKGNWPLVALFLALGVLSLFADSFMRPGHRRKREAPR